MPVAVEAVPSTRWTREVPYLRGPVPLSWLGAAQKAGGSALGVGALVWHLAGLTRRHSGLQLRPGLYATFGLSRHAVYRGLDRLVAAKLLRVHPRPGAASVVDLLPAAPPEET